MKRNADHATGGDTTPSESSGMGVSWKQAVLVVATVVVVAAIVALAAYTSFMKEKKEEGEGVRVVASFYPLAYMASRIGGEHVSVKLLLPYNEKLHTWQPASSDIVRADDADVILYNGLGADQWMEKDILPALRNRDSIRVVETAHNLELGPKHVQGTRTREGESQEHDHGKVDPHTWISPFLAAQQGRAIYEALVAEDPDHAEAYTTNWDRLRTELEGLDARYASRLANATLHDVFVTHAAFGYLGYRYGFDQHGVIGLSADEEPSTSVLVDLVDLMESYGVYAIFVDPVYKDEYAKTLQRELESRTGREVALLKIYLMLGPIDGMDYLGQMNANLDSLSEGLGAA